jgi:hypothetical protein
MMDDRTREYRISWEAQRQTYERAQSLHEYLWWLAMKGIVSQMKTSIQKQMFVPVENKRYG